MPAPGDADVEAQRGRARSSSISKRRASEDPAEPQRKWRWSKPATQLPVLQNLGRKWPSRTEKQGFFDGDSETPSQWPPERILFLLGMVFFPLWIFGAFWRWRDGFEPFADLHKWRCQVMLMMTSVIAAGLVVVEVVFREA